jgi:predicted short-subunit dehydrogenase-like oxidoreductase (DUF2520 family)
VTRPAAARETVEVVLVGRGRVGRTLAKRFAERGVTAVLLAGRGLAASGRARALVRRASVVWITVPDPHVASIEAVIAASLDGLGARALPIVVHSGGARGPEVLAACALRGAPVAVAHPAVSFGTTRTTLDDTVFVLDGAPRATRRLARLVRTLGARPLTRAVHGPRYHAALALAANGAAALAAAASAILVSGVPALEAPEAARLLGTLLRSVADNVARVGPSAALTGPIARGDAAAVARHLEALEPEERADYVAVSRLVLRAAIARGLPPAAREGIDAVLSAASRARPVRARRGAGHEPRQRATR